MTVILKPITFIPGYAPLGTPNEDNRIPINPDGSFSLTLSSVPGSEFSLFIYPSASQDPDEALVYNQNSSEVSLSNGDFVITLPEATFDYGTRRLELLYEDSREIYYASRPRYLGVVSGAITESTMLTKQGSVDLLEGDDTVAVAFDEPYFTSEPVVSLIVVRSDEASDPDYAIETGPIHFNIDSEGYYTGFSLYLTSAPPDGTYHLNWSAATY